MVVSEEAKKEEVKEDAEVPEVNIYDLLAKQKGAPTKEIVAGWKQRYNDDVFASIIGKGEVFIFRSINRSEWKQLNDQIQKSGTEDPMALHEAVVRKCVLFPNLGHPEVFAGIKAGTVPTLFEQITWYSNFMDPALAVRAVYEL